MDPDTLVDLFRHGLDRLDVNDAGLTIDGNNLDDLDDMAAVCLAIKTMTDTGDTLQVLHLYRLAVLTERLLITPWLPDPDITKQWLIARGELLAVELDRR